jgi:hypothetical protein
MWLYHRLLACENHAVDLAFKPLSKIHLIGQRLVDRLGRRKYGIRYPGNIIGGFWYGNDTAWRMALDLNRIVLYADKEGTLHDRPQRKFFSVVDGIIGGEGEGPLAPKARSCGALIAGFNPLSVDTVTARLMGFDILKLKPLAEGWQRPWLNLWGGEPSQIPVFSDSAAYRTIMSNHTDEFFGFEPGKGWLGHIEIGANT